MNRSLLKGSLRFVGVLAISQLMTTASADAATRVRVSLKNHRFLPAEVAAPASQPITIEITNLDPTPAEFESKTLRVEKIVTGGGRITIQMRPLSPGRYRFFDDFHEDTTEGFLVVR